MFDTVNGVLRVRVWPKKKKKRRSSAEVEREEAFRQAQWLTKIFMPDLMHECMIATEGTPLMPRDLGTLIIYNRLTYFLLPDGRKVYPTVAREDVSESLDVVEQRPWFMLYRGAEFWQGLAPGGAGQVLYGNGPDAAPQWGDLPPPPPPVGAKYALLGEATAAIGGAAELHVAGIDQTYTDLIISCLVRGNALFDAVNVYMRLNNVVTNNYDYSRVNRFGNVQELGVDKIDIGSAPAQNAVAFTAAPIEQIVPNYSGGAFFKTGSGTSFTRTINTVAGLIAQYNGWEFRSTASIDRVQIYPSTGAWAAGSVLRVYGRK